MMAIANMEDAGLIYLHHTLGAYIRERFVIGGENSELLKECCAFMEVDVLPWRSLSLDCGDD